MWFNSIKEILSCKWLFKSKFKNTYFCKTLIRVSILMVLLFSIFAFFIEPFLDHSFPNNYKIAIFITLFLMWISIAVMSLLVNIKNFIDPMDKLYYSLDNVKHWNFQKLELPNELMSELFQNYNDSMQKVFDNECKLIESNKMLSEYNRAIESWAIVSKTDTKWIITYVNDKFCQMCWHTKDELIWKSHNIVRHPDMSKETFKNMWETIKQKKVWQWEVKNLKKDWWYYWVFSTIIPILDKEENVVEYLSIRFDITKEKQLQQQMEQQRLYELNEKEDMISQLSNFNKMKDEFLSIASHELRTPMTAIKWYISMIIDWDIWEVDENAKKYLDKVLSNTNRLIDLINDMLDVAKLESWKVEIITDTFDFKSFLYDLHEDMKSLSEKKLQKFDINIWYDELHYDSDINKLKQVFINLLSNAIKFTPENWKISINSTIENDFIVTSIIDTWIWIAPENMDKIFEKFWQVVDSYTRYIWWTWLWLPIVKMILEKIWWNISVVSEVWKGSEFIIKLPLK